MSGCSTPVSGDDRESKRKKIRKGTTSCWECKTNYVLERYSFPAIYILTFARQETKDALSVSFALRRSMHRLSAAKNCLSKSRVSRTSTARSQS
jgi:hypothetical protein